MVDEKFAAPIEPAHLSFRDGALYSERFGDIYHSVSGGLEESRHVFIDGNRLPDRWRQGASLTVVETGFGCGLNFLATWDALEQQRGDVRLDFVSAEKFPFTRNDLARVLRSWPRLGSRASKMLEAYPSLTPGFHRIHFGRRVTLTLLLGDASEQLRELDASADAFFLDGFSPSRNPDIWTDELMHEVRRLAAPGATLATYSVAANVRRAIVNAGFDLRKIAGFGRKREMLVARFGGDHAARASSGTTAVIGAGVAGSSCALALARRGCEVELIDRASRPGAEASSNPAAMVRPYLTLDHSPRGRFSWSAFQYVIGCYGDLDSDVDLCWQKSGILQLARDPGHMARMRRALALSATPEDLVRWVDAGQGSSLCGVPVREAGIWFPSAGYVNGSALCAAMVDRGGSRVRFHPGTEIVRVTRTKVGWRILGADNATITVVDNVVFANGNGMQALLPQHDFGLQNFSGQVTGIRATSRELRSPVCRNGYLTPITGNFHFAGGTYDASNGSAVVSTQNSDKNLSRAKGVLPDLFATAVPESEWVGVRCASRNRAPLVGELSEGVFVSSAMGSRGFIWAPLAGEVLASQIAGAPCPLERSIAAGLSPRQFIAAETDGI